MLKENKIFCFSKELAGNEAMIHTELTHHHGMVVIFSAVLNMVQTMP